MTNTTTKLSPSVSAFNHEKYHIPLVIASPLADAKMRHIITCEAKGQNEITWYGLMDKDEDGDIIISDVFVPIQKVSPGSTNIKDFNAAINDCAKAKKGNNPKKLRAWFHLHPGGMSTNPSGIDVKQTNKYLETWPYLLRGIFNNQGSIQLDYFDSESGLAYKNLNYIVDTSNLYNFEEFDNVLKARVSEEPVKVPAKYKYNNNKRYDYGYQYETQEGSGIPMYKNDDFIRVGSTQMGALYIELKDALEVGEQSEIYGPDGIALGMNLEEAIQYNMFNNPKTAFKLFKKNLGMGYKDFKDNYPSVYTEIS